MSRNRTGALTGNLEWGKKGRKEEDALRGRNNSARRQTIAEQVAETEFEPSVYDQDEEILEDALAGGLPAGVTLNGHDYDADWDDYYDRYYDEYCR